LLDPDPPSLISVEAARRSEPTVVAPDARAKKEELLHAQATQKNDLGWVGVVLGSRSEKPGNVAAIVILFCFILIGVGFFMTDVRSGGSGELFFKLLAALLGPVGLALGYLFGSSKRD
jgi:ABC-type multidrug transport system permease subunit